MTLCSSLVMPTVSEKLAIDDILAKFPTYGSCRKGEYRISRENPAKTAELLKCACHSKVRTTPSRSVFQSYEFLKPGGWEWSVFKDNGNAIKVPAGIFPETSDPRYLENTKQNLSVIGRYVDPMFIAETRFSETPPNITQPLFKRSGEVLDVFFTQCDARKWRLLCEQFLRLLDAEEWLPDLDIRFDSDASDHFGILNVMTDEHDIPKLIDFTAYFDEFRLYEERTQREVRKRREVLQRILGKLKRQD